MPSATWRFNLIYFPTCLARAFLVRSADTWIQVRLRRNVQLIGIRWPAMLMWSLFALGLLNFVWQWGATLSAIRFLTARTEKSVLWASLDQRQQKPNVHRLSLPTFRSTFERPADVKLLSRMNHL